MVSFYVNLRFGYFDPFSYKCSKKRKENKEKFIAKTLPSYHFTYVYKRTPISREVRLSAKVDRKNLCELISSKTMIMGDLLPGKPTPVLLLTRYNLLLLGSVVVGTHHFLTEV